MILRVKIKPNAKTDEISLEADGNWRIKIKAPPVEGKANKYLAEYLSKVLKLPKSKIALLKGETSAFKTLEIEADENYVVEKLAVVSKQN
jgi:uncharacterized protein (TIGR00251 family)